MGAQRPVAPVQKKIHSLHNESGQVTIDKEHCSRCGQCAQVCPGGVLSIADDTLQFDAGKNFGCIACGHCMMVCAKDAIKVTHRGFEENELIPLPAKGECASAESLRALFQRRRSTRIFKDEKVDQTLLEQIVEAASYAPMGIPPFDVGCVVLNGKENVRDLAWKILASYEQFGKFLKPWLLPLFKPFIKHATYEQFKTFLLPLANIYSEGKKKGVDYLFYGAPALMIFHHSPYADAADAMIVCTYAMLAAESLGLGTTMIGAGAPMIQRDKKLSRQLGIPEINKAAIVLIIGHPAVRYKRSIRRTLSSVRFISENK